MDFSKRMKRQQSRISIIVTQMYTIPRQKGHFLRIWSRNILHKLLLICYPTLCSGIPPHLACSVLRKSLSSIRGPVCLHMIELLALLVTCLCTSYASATQHSCSFHPSCEPAATTPSTSTYRALQYKYCSFPSFPFISIHFRLFPLFQVPTYCLYPNICNILRQCIWCDASGLTCISPWHKFCVYFQFYFTDCTHIAG
jgi:hypothetical protein